MISTPVVVGFDSTSLNSASAPSSAKRRLPGAQHERVDGEQQRVDEAVGEEGLDQLARCRGSRGCRSVAGLQVATVSTASPCRSTEFIHSTGSRGERETTYFVLRLEHLPDRVVLRLLRARRSRIFS